MNEIVRSSGRNELALSILDDQYSISLRNEVHKKQLSYDDVIQRAVKIAFDAQEVDVEVADEPAVRYVVDIAPEIQEQIKQGLVRLDYGKDGQVYAQLRDENNRFGKKLPIKEELIEQGVDPLELKMAMQMAAIQQKLDQIADTLDEISQGVSDVIKGQQNDRLGLYYSGMTLLLEAQEIQDESFRKLVAAQALQSLSNAVAQMTQEIQEDIRYLVSGDYRGKKQGRAAEIQRRMANIDKCFDVIHRAAVLKASVYYSAGEASALLLTVEEYARFIDRVITPYAGNLIEFDPNDTLLMGGKWESRAKALEGTEQLRKQLSSGSTFYLEDACKKAEEEDDVVDG